MNLLTNFVDQFNKSLSRLDQINYQDDQKGDGNTILHQAILMDYEEGKELMRLGDVTVQQDGTGGEEILEMVDIKVIKKSL
jgi:ankyrin repeat protein